MYLGSRRVFSRLICGDVFAGRRGAIGHLHNLQGGWNGVLHSCMYSILDGEQHLFDVVETCTCNQKAVCDDLEIMFLLDATNLYSGSISGQTWYCKQQARLQTACQPLYSSSDLVCLCQRLDRPYAARKQTLGLRLHTGY
jgi:hypothetical protein